MILHPFVKLLRFSKKYTVHIQSKFTKKYDTKNTHYTGKIAIHAFN